jgi:hypothetical protein
MELPADIRIRKKAGWPGWQLKKTEKQEGCHRFKGKTIHLNWRLNSRQAIFFNNIPG